MSLVKTNDKGTAQFTEAVGEKAKVTFVLNPSFNAKKGETPDYLELGMKEATKRINETLTKMVATKLGVSLVGGVKIDKVTKMSIGPNTDLIYTFSAPSSKVPGTTYDMQPSAYKAKLKDAFIGFLGQKIIGSMTDKNAKDAFTEVMDAVE